MRSWIAGCLVAAISGCGTLKTLHDEEGAADNLAKWQSECHSIPRTYSGAAYQFCNLNGPPRSGSHWAASPIVLDMVISSIADTMLLPYTGYLQYQHGNIRIRRTSIGF
ncbi:MULTISPECIES: YceK/YidQ family lipoprotein [unclassified Pseudomonas]|uniref:YceK/YidQ family lipoprotein n=1 Tax=unclassified Pseudomonas TaxID=196821 RepID=UPI002AC8A0E2|nr:MULTISPECIES: YceK/YidQ family lipoprotein [unclassified Pseudomonas]MEB0039652.1 YceK/YidQ family lipoprotein [Pseudomonas sp. MH10]MEB0077115.1 YceK/YidQ family lipoprotein [Pseudomonas sp. MH10out]MEB0089917.1 YceK/YidQ family lipoprotein [Pseudomonas sp. CCI4.2]MEB0103882.1 YceK/YidQ family lipoprotein [Pseudomonas sp. CCI3.2]MEB0120128.1 YceK/YidQ family lipoprotein [Pseudomonas sp. CCI1.2]